MRTERESERGSTIHLRPEMYSESYLASYQPQSELELKASQISRQAHEGVLRKDGKPYWTHTQATAAILSQWGIKDENILAAAWLHDVIEDNPLYDKDFLTQEFNSDIAYLVDCVTKFKSRDGDDSNDQLTYKKMFEMQQVEDHFDPRGGLVKLADRLHNMMTLSSMPEHKQVEKAWDTLNVYVPLAEAYGMWVVKVQLEDLAFKYVDKTTYDLVHDQIDKDQRLRASFYEKEMSNIEDTVSAFGINAKVRMKVGGYYSSYQKRQKLAALDRSNFTDFSDLNDILSVRVLTKDIISAYTVIGLLHQHYGPRVDIAQYDEYMGATKRDNGYEALQTTIRDPNNGFFEIAVTTEDKEEFNNWGLVSKIRNGQPISEYNLKLILLKNGDNYKVIILNVDDTGVDLAYKLRNSLGASVETLTVDGETQNAIEVLPNASIVEINPVPLKKAPNPIYLAHSSLKTQRKIWQQLTREKNNRIVDQGRSVAGSLLSSRGLLYLEDLPLDKQENLLLSIDSTSLKALHFEIATNRQKASDLLDWLNREDITKESLGITTVAVSGLEGVGILRFLSEIIYTSGGSIREVKRTGEENYQLRILIKELSPQAEEKIRKIIESEVGEGKMFETGVVV